VLILEKFIEIISLRTEKFDVLLDSSLIHLTFLFEKDTLNVINLDSEVSTSPSKLNETDDQQKEAKPIAIKENVSQIKDIKSQKTSHNPIDNQSKTPANDSGDKQKWEKVIFDLRRAKFGKMVLGALLRNVEIPRKTDDKLALKFKSKTLHDHFKSEWQIDLAREAVKKAIVQVYGDNIKLVLEEPDEEQSNTNKTTLLNSEIVKSALAMGAKIEEESEG